MRQHGDIGAVGRRRNGGFRSRGHGVRARELALVYLSTEEGGRRPHRHVAIFNDDGDGVTTAEDGHTHEIRELEIQPAADGHTHELGTTRVEPVSYRLYFGIICRPS